MINVETQTPPGSASAAPTAAEQAALRNWERNLQALNATQPALRSLLATSPIAATWLFARDGALTCHDSDGRWWAGCSVPRRASQLLLRKLDLRGPTGCFLHPSHAAQMAVAMEKLRPDQALIAIVPSVTELAVALHCADFAANIAMHRLWFASGNAWPDELGAILRDHPGLSPPQQFIRTALLLEDQATELISAAQVALTKEAERRTRMAAQYRAAPLVKTGQWCLVASSRFRLWDDAGSTLCDAAAAAHHQIIRLDPDSPINTSSLRLAEAAAQADVILTDNRTRGDLPDVIHPDRRIITWITRPAIGPHDRVGPRDALLLADPNWVDLAQRAGWPSDRLHVAGWPVMPIPPGIAAGAANLAIIADTTPLPAQPPEFDLSTHGLLWELIARELIDDPFRVGPDAHAYLASRMARATVAEDGLDQRRFVQELILPAYQQGLARLLLAADLPLRIHGCGWDQIGPFAAHAAGPIATRQALQGAVRTATALVHVWPAQNAHPIDGLGRPVVRGQQGRTAFLAAACAALAGRLPLRPVEIPRLGAGLLAERIRML